MASKPSKNSTTDILTMRNDEEAIIRCLRLGACGFLTKDIEKDQLRAAIDSSLEKGYYYSDLLTRCLIGSVVAETHRQREVDPASVVFPDFFIFELVLRSIRDIKTELRRLYPWWINTGTEKKGEYQNRIEQLEVQVGQLEEKFFTILQSAEKQKTSPRLPKNS